MRPKGGAPPSVYWRRRLLLFAVVLLVAAGGFKLFGGGGDGGGPESGTNSPTASDQASRPAETNEHDRSDKNPRKRRDRDTDGDVVAGERDVPVTLTTKRPCDPATVTVTPSLPSDSYAGDAVTVRLAFSTTADAPCELSLTEHALLVSISGDNGLVWESEQCTTLIDSDRVRLAPGWLTYVEAAWSGRASVHSCGDNADFAAPGTYEVRAAVLGGEPTSATVELVEKPERDNEDADKSDGPRKGDDATDEPQDDATDAETGEGQT